MCLMTCTMYNFYIQQANSLFLFVCVCVCVCVCVWFWNVVGIATPCLSLTPILYYRVDKLFSTVRLTNIKRQIQSVIRSFIVFYVQVLGVQWAEGTKVTNQYLTTLFSHPV